MLTVFKKLNKFLLTLRLVVRAKRRLLDVHFGSKAVVCANRPQDAVSTLAQDH